MTRNKRKAKRLSQYDKEKLIEHRDILRRLLVERQNKTQSQVSRKEVQE